MLVSKIVHVNSTRREYKFMTWGRLMLVSLAALLRVAASFAADSDVLLLSLSSIVWITAALLFLGVYAPILVLHEPR